MSYRVLTLRNNFWAAPIFVEHTREGEDQEIPGDATYEIELEAAGDGVPSVTKRFRVFVDHGNLKMILHGKRMWPWRSLGFKS